MESSIITNNENNKLSMIEKYNCKTLYFDLSDCVINNENLENKNICVAEFSKLGECIINGMKIEERTNKRI